MNTQYDIKNRLKSYFPIFFELLGENVLDWKTIEKRFALKLDEHKRKFQITGKPIIVEASLYHIITASIIGNQHARPLLDFITKIFEELILRLDKDEKRLVRKNLFDLLTNIDKKYLNFFGELCVLNQVKRNTELILTATEEPLDPANKGGTKIDFTFNNAKDYKKLLVEIVNIHINETQTSSNESIKNLLEQKIGAKLRRKGILTNTSFCLIPVIWGPINDIKKITGYYHNFNPKFANTSLPVCFMTFTDKNGGRVHRFGTIDSILNGT